MSARMSCTLIALFVMAAFFGQTAATFDRPTNQNDSLAFSIHPGNMITTFVKTDSNILHMEVDRSITGNILFSDDFSLKTTDGRTVTTVTHVSALNNVRGFTQISSTEIVITDYDDHCLRLFNRVTQELSVYAGVCGESRSPTSNSRKGFNRPHSVMQDMMNPEMLLVSGEGDCYISHVNMSGPAPHNITKFSNCISPKGISQDPQTGDIYITRTNSIYKIGYASKISTSIDGGSTGFYNGAFGHSLYNRPNAILPIGDNKLVVADTLNDRLRVLDMEREDTSSFCSGVAGHKDGFSGDCSLFKPRSLLVVNQTLYIGEGGYIRMIKVDKDANLCEEIVLRRSSPIDATLVGLPGKFHLKPGVYDFQFEYDQDMCNVSLYISDMSLMRRLFFSVEYSFECDNFEETRSIWQMMAEQIFPASIDAACGNECKVNIAATEDPTVTCKRNTVTMTWLTDTTYDGQTLSVPAALKQRVSSRLPSTSFYILVSSPTPRVVFPRQPVFVGLKGFCNDGTVYDVEGDTCQEQQ